jgi:hypothetical protein
MLKSLLTTVTILSASALGAYADAKDDVAAAAKKLAAAENYSWKSTTEGGFGGTNEGQTQKDGLTHLSLTMRDNTIDVVLKGDKGAMKTEEGWKSTSEAGDQQGPGRFIARMVQNFKAPAVQAQELAEKTKELKKADDAIAGDLTEEGAKSLLTLGGGRRGGGNPAANAPAIANAKGSAKFWTNADGMLTKVQYNVKGTMTFNGEDREIDRTTTIEIKDIGTTKVEVPADAKSKL